MAFKWFSGFETGDTSEWPTVVGSVVIDTSLAKNTGGGASAKFTPTANAYTESTTGYNLATAYTRINIWSTLGGVSKTITVLGLYTSGGSIISSVRAVTDGSGNQFLRLWNEVANAQVGADFAITSNILYSVELSTTISASIGVVEMRVNQVVQATGSSLNTGSTNIDRFRVGCITSNAASTGNIWIDDCIISSSGYPGWGWCFEVQFSASTPAYNTWTKNGGTVVGGSSGVWVQTPFTTAKSATSATNGQAQTARCLQLFVPSAQRTGLGVWNPVGDTLNAAKAGVIAKGDGTATSLSIRVRKAATDTDTAITVTSSAAYYETALFTDTWTNLASSAVEVGAVNTSVSGTLTVYSAWLMVDIAPLASTKIGFLRSCGAETGDTSEYFSVSGTNSADSSITYNSGYSVKQTPGTSFAEVRDGNGLASSSTYQTHDVYARFYLYSTLAVTSGTTTAFISQLEGASSAAKVLLKIAVTTSSTVLRLLYVTGPGGDGNGQSTQVGSDYVINPNQWYQIELKSVSTLNSPIHALDGIAELRVNGVVVRTVTGINLGNYQHAQTSYGCSFASNSANLSGFIYTDNQCVNDTQYPGNGYSIARQFQAGTPTNNAWTKNGQATAALCWSETPFSATNNCSDTTNGDAQTAIIANFSSAGSAQEGTYVVGASDSINICKIGMVAKTTVAGAVSMRARIGGVNTDTVRNLTTSDAYYEVNQLSRAINATITYANLTDGTTEIGVLNQNTTGRTNTVEDMWFFADVQPSPQTYSEALSTSSTTSLVLVRSIGKPISSSVASSPAVVKGVGKVLTAAQGSVISLANQIAKPLSAAQGNVISLVKQIAKPLSVVQSGAISLTKQIAKPLARAVAQTANVSKAVNKTLALSSSVAAALSNSVGKVFTAEIVISASIAQAISLILATSSDLTATVIKAVTNTLSAAITGTASLVKQTDKPLDTDVTVSVDVAQQISKAFAVITSTIVSLQRTISHTFTVAQAQTVSVTKSAVKTLTAAVTSIATLVKQRVRSLLVKLRLFKAASRYALSVQKVTSRYQLSLTKTASRYDIMVTKVE